MPGKNEIEKFRKILLEIANEGKIREERGEEIENLPFIPEPSELPKEVPIEKPNTLGEGFPDLPDYPNIESTESTESHIEDFTNLLDNLDLSLPKESDITPLEDFGLELPLEMDMDFTEPQGQIDDTEDFDDTNNQEIDEDTNFEEPQVNLEDDSTSLDNFLSSDFLGDTNIDFNENEVSLPTNNELDSFEPSDDFSSESQINVDTSDIGELPDNNDISFEEMPIDNSFEMPSSDDPIEDNSSPFIDNDISFGENPLDASSEDAFAGFNFDDDFGALSKNNELSSLEIDHQLDTLDKEQEKADGFNIENSIPSDLSFGGFEEPVPISSDKKRSEYSSPSAKKAKEGKKQSTKKDEVIEEDFSEPVELSEKEIDTLQDTLLSYPLNLRIAVEEIITERLVEEPDINKVIHLLVRGVSALEMAKVASKIIDKKIEIPKDYHKKTAAEFEKEKASFWYAFKHNILPMMAICAITLAIVSAVFFMIYQFVYIPLAADGLYREGYELILKDRYEEGEIAFNKALKLNKVKDWFYRYAEAYSKKQNIIATEKKYLALQQNYPFDKKGALDYAHFEEQIQNFEKAGKIVQNFILEKNQWDIDGILYRGDIYIAWGDSLLSQAAYKDIEVKDMRQHATEAEEHYETARKSYARLIQRYGLKDLFRGRMARYFVRVENEKEVASIRNYFVGKKNPDIDAITISEIAGFLITKNNIDGVRQLLQYAKTISDTTPEVHYEFSRLFRLVNEPSEELKAIKNAEKMFLNSESSFGIRLFGKNLEKYIYVLNRKGELLLLSRDQKIDEYVALTLEAETNFLEGISRYEQAVNNHIYKVDTTGKFGLVYSNLANINYYDRSNYERALSGFDKAESNGYVTKETNYKRGYIYYILSTKSNDNKTSLLDQKSLEKSLLYFSRSGSDFLENKNLLQALGNTFYLREDYSAASGYYLELLNRLNLEKEEIDLIEPQARPEHGDLITRIKEVTNNLGVTLYKLGQRNGNTQTREQGMQLLIESSKMFDSLSRDQNTMMRTDTKNLANLNIQAIMYPATSTRSPTNTFYNGVFDPTTGATLQIYPELIKDPEGKKIEEMPILQN